MVKITDMPMASFGPLQYTEKLRENLSISRMVLKYQRRALRSDIRPQLCNCLMTEVIGSINQCVRSKTVAKNAKYSTTNTNNAAPTLLPIDESLSAVR